MSATTTQLEQHLSECLSRQATLHGLLREVETDIMHLRIAIARNIKSIRDPHILNQDGEP